MPSTAATDYLTYKQLLICGMVLYQKEVFLNAVKVFRPKVVRLS